MLHRVAPTEPVRYLTRYYAELLEEPVSIMEAVTLDARQLERGIAPACYADLFHGGITMSNADLLPSLLFKINQNQLALEAAIMELTFWVEQRGSGDVGGNVRGALETISKNEEFINMTLAVLMTPE